MRGTALWLSQCECSRGEAGYKSFLCQLLTLKNGLGIEKGLKRVAAASWGTAPASAGPLELGFDGHGRAALRLPARQGWGLLFS